MSTPIENMIDSAVQCGKCGTQGFMKCDCYVQLRCSERGCTNKRFVERDNTIPKNAKMIISPCPEHCDGDFSGERYLDSEGNDVMPVDNTS